MKFEVSERINSIDSKKNILNSLENQFKKISSTSKIQGDILEVTLIEGSFGSINRSDKSIIKIINDDYGYLLIAEVTYIPSFAFWIIFIISLFSYVFWLIPVIFYLTQKKTVREGIESVFIRVKNEFQSDRKSDDFSKQNNYLDELEKLDSLRKNGIITEEEFQLKKKSILKLN